MNADEHIVSRHPTHTLYASTCDYLDNLIQKFVEQELRPCFGGFGGFGRFPHSYPPA